MANVLLMLGPNSLCGHSSQCANSHCADATPAGATKARRAYEGCRVAKKNEPCRVGIVLGAGKLASPWAHLEKARQPHERYPAEISNRKELAGFHGNEARIIADCNRDCVREFRQMQSVERFCDAA